MILDYDRYIIRYIAIIPTVLLLRSSGMFPVRKFISNSMNRISRSCSISFLISRKSDPRLSRHCSSRGRVSTNHSRPQNFDHFVCYSPNMSHPEPACGKFVGKYRPTILAISLAEIAVLNPIVDVSG